MITKNILQEFGFNLVALPKPDIYPLQILAKKDKETVFKLGNINDLFTQGDEIPPPTIENDKTIPNLLKGTYLVNLELKSKVSLLNFWKSRFNGANFNAQITDNDKIIFSYSNGKVSEISSLLNLNAYINDAKINDKKISTFKDQLENDEIYIITGILKSNDFQVELVDNSNFKTNIEVSDTKKVVEVSSEINRQKESNNIISHKSETDYLIVGFQAVKLIYNKPFWSTKKANYKIKSVDGIILRSEEDFPVIKIDADEIIDIK